ncbi:hypothetical protein GIW70_13905 [Pseudomonas syringae]|nr:hypothetical protein [Pseudomonas syringae]MCF5069279.1 hypothetical protein [Pseudomonas syringae]
MKKILAALTFAGLLSTSLHGLAAAPVTVASALPPGTPIPEVDQKKSSKADAANTSKKGEEASGSNSSSDPSTADKETKPIDSTKDKKTKTSNGSGS